MSRVYFTKQPDKKQEVEYTCKMCGFKTENINEVVERTTKGIVCVSCFMILVAKSKQ